MFGGSTTKTTSWSEQMMPGEWEVEKGHIKRLFTLNSWQYLVILGIAISGLAAFVNTYNAWSGINAQLQSCTQSATLQKELFTQFVVILVLSCLAVVIGLLLAWLFRSGANQRKLLTLGITTVGIFGILYALSIKFQKASNKTKLAISWIAFVGFMILGFFMSSGLKITGPKIEAHDWST